MGVCETPHNILSIAQNLLYRKLHFFLHLFKITDGIGNITMQRHCEQIYDLLIILFHSAVDPVYMIPTKPYL